MLRKMRVDLGFEWFAGVAVLSTGRGGKTAAGTLWGGC